MNGKKAYTCDEFIQLMIEKPYTIKMGAENLAKRYDISPDDINKARIAAKQQLGIGRYKNFIPGNFTKKFPKILIYDTETAPMRAFVWRRWKENISLDQTISEWFMLAWSAKWLYSGEVMGDRLTGQEALQEDDSRIMKSLWELIDEADIVIAHNAKKADIPWMNTRFILNGLNPPKPYYVIDTLDVAKKQFGFSSNKLDALAGYFNIEHKMDTDFNLWKRCLDGDDQALQYMSDYNKKDTAILEEVYLRIRPWIKSHPNVGNYFESVEPICSYCGSDDLEEIPGQYYYTSVSKYKLYRCRHCGGVVRGRANLNVREGTRKEVYSVAPAR